ncbi:MAG: glycosyltransferase [Lachnospiraceae bacterium]|nr:glycosyltransferase [Lachnospiraceae bacterium]
MSDEGVRVSLITVTFNSEKTLERTIRSVLQQTVKPYEYILVDGLSKDDTLKIIRDYKDRFESEGIRYRYISEKDEGIYDAMNKGIGMAEGDIIGIINSDDWYENIAVETVIKDYERYHFDLFYADLKMHLPNGMTFIKHSRNRKYRTSRDWNHPTTFITAEVYKRYRYRNLTLHDDYDLILRLFRAGVKTVVDNTVIANFTMNGKSHERDIKKALERCRIKYGIYRDNGYSPLYFFECFTVEFLKLIIG